MHNSPSSNIEYRGYQLTLLRSSYSLLRFTGSFKWPTIAGAIPFSVLGTALLIHFRTPEADVGYLAMCQVFNGIAGAFFATGTQLAVMAAVSHNEIAVVLAILGLFGSVGAAIGMAVSDSVDPVVFYLKIILEGFKLVHDLADLIPFYNLLLPKVVAANTRYNRLPARYGQMFFQRRYMTISPTAARISRRKYTDPSSCNNHTLWVARFGMLSLRLMIMSRGRWSLLGLSLYPYC